MYDRAALPLHDAVHENIRWMCHVAHTSAWRDVIDSDLRTAVISDRPKCSGWKAARAR